MKTILSTSRPGRRAFLGAALGLLAALAGCDTTGAFVATNASGDVPADAPGYTDRPCRVMGWWEPSVRFTQDPTHNGAPTAGLAGRIYLFGPEIKDPLVGNGSITVALFDDARPPGQQGPAPVYQWTFDAATLQRLLRRDVIGWGYTLFLPCVPYRPEDDVQRMAHVTLKVRYDQEKCATLFADPALLTLSDPNSAAAQQVTHNPAAVRPRQ
jgi:hypothetical protein